MISKIKSKEISFRVRKSPHHIQVLDLNKPSKTIHNGYVFQPRLFILLRKGKKFYIRKMLNDELKQIQSFPSSFKFIGTENSITQQIGNAVPPKIVTKIAINLIRNNLNRKQ